MERFWRTLPEGCLDHIGTPRNLHDVQVRLLAFLSKHYQVAPHAALMGKSPAEVYETAPRYNVLTLLPSSPSNAVLQLAPKFWNQTRQQPETQERVA
jgi:hypothetical protein